MNNLKRPLVFFDLETTGLEKPICVVQFAAVKIHPSGDREELELLIKPHEPISEQATLIHGITNEDVKDKPDFDALYPQIQEFTKGCDLAGHNIVGYDIPVLSAEFGRVGIEWPQYEDPKTRIVDTLKIEAKIYSRKLSDCYLRYTGNELQGAHDAMTDVKATIDVLLGQARENALTVNSESLEQFYGGTEYADYGGYFKTDRNRPTHLFFAFGKHKGKPVRENINYANWMLHADFPLQTKRVLRRHLGL